MITLNLSWWSDYWLGWGVFLLRLGIVFVIASIVGLVGVTWQWLRDRSRPK